MHEPTIRTADASEALRFPAVTGLRANLTKITSGNDGKVSLSIALEAHDPETIEAIKELIQVQQGDVYLSVEGVQAELQFDA